MMYLPIPAPFVKVYEHPATEDGRVPPSHETAQRYGLVQHRRRTEGFEIVNGRPIARVVWEMSPGPTAYLLAAAAAAFVAYKVAR